MKTVRDKDYLCQPALTHFHRGIKSNTPLTFHIQESTWFHIHRQRSAGTPLCQLQSPGGADVPTVQSVVGPSTFLDLGSGMDCPKTLFPPRHFQLSVADLNPSSSSSHILILSSNCTFDTGPCSDVYHLCHSKNYWTELNWTYKNLLNSDIPVCMLLRLSVMRQCWVELCCDRTFNGAMVVIRRTVRASSVPAGKMLDDTLIMYRTLVSSLRVLFCNV